MQALRPEFLLGDLCVWAVNHLGELRAEFSGRCKLTDLRYPFGIYPPSIYAAPKRSWWIKNARERH